jgi:hypothetical protein
VTGAAAAIFPVRKPLLLFLARGTIVGAWMDDTIEPFTDR